jgi:transcription initiation factor TFIIIB Brf1 subunit/transcription initiation factor TFIIB
MTDWRYEVCPNCKSDSYHVRNDRQGRSQLVCAGCSAVLIDEQPDVPDPTAQPAPQWGPF